MPDDAAPQGEASAERAYSERLIAIIHSNHAFMHIFEAVRDCDPPDWLVGAGVLRDLVWDHLHASLVPTRHRDVDVAFFDPADLSSDRDRQVETQLSRRLPGVPWQARNQAAVHLWYEERFGYAVPAVRSSAEGVATWPETVTSIAVRLRGESEIDVVAPLGLSDMFEMVLRRNPRRVSVEEYRRRAREKRILERWPQVRFVDG
jgi:hypothetical protein